MVGYSTMKEVAIWAQLSGPGEVSVEYWTASEEKRVRSAPVNTRRRNGYTALITVEDLEPGTSYRYQLVLDGSPVPAIHSQRFVTQPLWQWRHDAPDFHFALGSCAFINESVYDRPGKPYGGNYEIFEQILAKQPGFMLWMGDNVYLREADWNSRSGIYRRYAHTRKTPELQGLLASVHHYAIWDDHDYGPDNSNRSFWNKDITLDAFTDFWANPNYNATGKGGLTGTFQWHDAQFFLLDNRWFRSANGRRTGEPQVFGHAQIEWLLDAMTSSKATFKFVVSPGVFLSDVKTGENHILLAPKERRRLIDGITKERIPGVVFLSGDIHRSQLTRLDRRGSYPLYEWSVSPLTAGTYTPRNERPGNRVKGSLFGERNFGVTRVTGPAQDRALVLELYDVEGERRWQTRFTAAELGYSSADR